MTASADLNRQVTLTLDLATFLLLQDAIGYIGFHDPILEQLTDRQQQAIWAGSDAMLAALSAEALGDLNALTAAAEVEWDRRHAQ